MNPANFVKNLSTKSRRQPGSYKISVENIRQTFATEDQPSVAHDAIFLAFIKAIIVFEKCRARVIQLQKAAKIT
jgi:hypothetical protein